MADRRVYHKGWQDRRPGWTRRARWFVGKTTIRVEFTDVTGKCSRVYNKYTEAEKATRDWEAFITERLTVDDILKVRYDG